MRTAMARTFSEAYVYATDSDLAEQHWKVLIPANKFDTIAERVV